MRGKGGGDGRTRWKEVRGGEGGREEGGRGEGERGDNEMGACWEDGSGRGARNVTPRVLTPGEFPTG
jgi:hypothetical protein